MNRPARRTWPLAVAAVLLFVAAVLLWLRPPFDHMAAAGAAAPGLLLDTRTGLLWTQADNGADIDWQGARRHCAQLGMELPGVEELVAIHDENGPSKTRCGEYTCRVSPRFRLTGPWFWSGKANGPAESWFVTLTGGGRGSGGSASAVRLRALCVRRA